MDELVDALRKQLAAALNLDSEAVAKLGPHDQLFGPPLGLDSIDALELVVMLERHYGIRITDIEEGRAAFASLDAMAAFIRKRGAAP